jgi:curved DNA-binding protein
MIFVSVSLSKACTFVLVLYQHKNPVSMEFIDYYKVLQIDKNATAEDVKKSYRRLARKLHPDLNPNDKEAHKKFQEINEANEVLSDPEKRKKYDQYGKDWQHSDQFEKQSQRRPGSESTYGSADFSEGDFSSFFESMFGGQTGRQQTRFRGQDYHAELHLNLIDIWATGKRELAVNGKNIRITIPAGVENGQIIKLKGYGAPGMNGGPNGDLYITFQIVDHEKFKRVGNDLYTTATLNLYTAVLGGETTIETMDGKVKMKVVAGTQPGTKVRLKGKGVPVYKHEGQYGDLYVTYDVELPTNLTDRHKALFTELSQLK